MYQKTLKHLTNAGNNWLQTLDVSFWGSTKYMLKIQAFIMDIHETAGAQLRKQKNCDNFKYTQGIR